MMHIVFNKVRERACKEAIYDAHSVAVVLEGGYREVTAVQYHHLSPFLYNEF